MSGFRNSKTGTVGDMRSDLHFFVGDLVTVTDQVRNQVSDKLDLMEFELKTTAISPLDRV